MSPPTWCFYFPCRHVFSFFLNVLVQYVRVEAGTSFIPAGLTGATSISRNQNDTAEEKIKHPLKGGCVCAPKKLCSRTKASLKTHISRGCLWQEPGHCGKRRGSFGHELASGEQALVWWKATDLHSSGLTENYFRTIWSFPHKRNNFRVSSFIYLMCIFSI